MSGRRTSRRSRSSGPTLTSIWWRDIPVQVLATTADGDGDPVRAELPTRFGHAVDRAALTAGLAGTDDYLEQWQRRTRPCDGDPASAVAAEVERLVADHPRDVLATLVANGGRRPGSDDPLPPSEPTPGSSTDRAEPTDEVPT